jgi:hypothetical protein
LHKFIFILQGESWSGNDGAALQAKGGGVWGCARVVLAFHFRKLIESKAKGHGDCSMSFWY